MKCDSLTQELFQSYLLELGMKTVLIVTVQDSRILRESRSFCMVRNISGTIFFID
jgi:hypothetical protein